MDQIGVGYGPRIRSIGPGTLFNSLTTVVPGLIFQSYIASANNKHMKKILSFAAACFVAGSLSAQDSGFNAGLDVAMPIGDFGDLFSVGFGPSVGYDKEAGDQGLLGLDLSFLFMSSKEEFIKSGKTLSLLGHYKYFFNEVREGAYAMGNLGWASVGYSVEILNSSTSTSAGGLSYGIGAGYYVSERIDVSLRYQGIRATEDGDATASSGEASNTLSMVGLRVAYGF